MLAVFDREEDSATFWKRSNARLGIDDGMGEGKGKAPVEHPCAVCGVIIALDRMPKDRHDVICSSCRGALGGMYDDDDREAANSYVRERKSKQRGLLDGLPEMSQEDLEAIDGIKALFDHGNSGRSGNRRKSSGRSSRRRKPGNNRKNTAASGDSRDNNRSNRRRRRSGRRGPSGSGGSQKQEAKSTD